MCGIIGKVGVNNVVPTLLNGLRVLEYRGYDSAGIVVLNDKKFTRVRTVGEIKNLKNRVEEEGLCGNIGIGHTRWATHGAVNTENAHPHSSPQGKFMVVHNGIIENADELKSRYLKENNFKSQTDTEVVAHLLEKFYNGNVPETISTVCEKLKGSYALGIICIDDSKNIFATAKGSPLVVALEESGGYIASDIMAIEKDVGMYYRLAEGEICRVNMNVISFYDNKCNSIQKLPEIVEASGFVSGKNGYQHYMLKEIFEQPKAVENTVKSYIKEGRIQFERFNVNENFFKNDIENIVIVACGSAYHAGLVGKFVLERLTKIPCSVEIASEFRYGSHLVNNRTLGIFISQSGETADTLESLKLSKKLGVKTLSIVNVKHSAIAVESDTTVFTNAGREVAVATTKAYSAQLSALYALALYIGEIKGTLKPEEYNYLLRELQTLPKKISDTLECTKEKTFELSESIAKENDIFFIGRLGDYATCSEGSLKMKEITYINSQSYPAGELKHGTISLITNGTPVIAVATKNDVFSKTVSNLAEVVSRGAKSIVITDEEAEKVNAECVITVPKTSEVFSPSLTVLPLQLLSYYTASKLQREIDKPKNLAKSVTVE
ncbi:MAG: glutamine--fructose-6-phosphate transaminase (isomerizing) [Oscillospiraceae bacterium]|nr:glutamine--fructose-6-phosphate transaminase (isomerizing) [Oscillospiraceae bacterium]